MAPHGGQARDTPLALRRVKRLGKRLGPERAVRGAHREPQLGPLEVPAPDLPPARQEPRRRARFGGAQGGDAALAQAAARQGARGRAPGGRRARGARARVPRPRLRHVEAVQRRLRLRRRRRAQGPQRRRRLRRAAGLDLGPRLHGVVHAGRRVPVVQQPRGAEPVAGDAGAGGGAGQGGPPDAARWSCRSTPRGSWPSCLRLSRNSARRVGSLADSDGRARAGSPGDTNRASCSRRPTSHRGPSSSSSARWWVETQIEATAPGYCPSHRGLGTRWTTT